MLTAERCRDELRTYSWWLENLVAQQTFKSIDRSRRIDGSICRKRWSVECNVFSRTGPVEIFAWLV